MIENQVWPLRRLPNHAIVGWSLLKDKYLPGAGRSLPSNCPALFTWMRLRGSPSLGNGSRAAYGHYCNLRARVCIRSCHPAGRAVEVPVIFAMKVPIPGGGGGTKSLSRTCAGPSTSAIEGPKLHCRQFRRDCLSTSKWPSGTESQIQKHASPFRFLDSALIARSVRKPSRTINRRAVHAIVCEMQGIRKLSKNLSQNA